MDKELYPLLIFLTVLAFVGCFFAVFYFVRVVKKIIETYKYRRKTTKKVKKDCITISSSLKPRNGKLIPCFVIVFNNNLWHENIDIDEKSIDLLIQSLIKYKIKAGIK